MAQTGNRAARRKRGRSFGLAEALITALFVIGGVVVALWDGQRLGPASALVADGFQRLEPRVYEPGLPVRIVAIDGESLARFGQWPWPRTFIAGMIERLTAMGAAAIAIDILFAEPDRTSPELQTTLNRGTNDAARPTLPMGGVTMHDTRLAHVMGNAPVAIAALPAAGMAETEPLVRKYGIIAAGSDPRDTLAPIASVDEPLDALIGAASGYGIGGVSIGESAVLRRINLFSNVGGDISPSLTMEALRVAQAARGYILRSSDAQGETGSGTEPVVTEVRNGGVTIPLGSDGGVWVRYAGPQSARTVPAWRVLEGNIEDQALRAAFEGQIVLLAATAAGLSRPVVTPLGVAMQPVEIQAELLEQVLAGVSLQRPDWAPGAEAVAVLVLGIATAFFTARRSVIGGALLSGLLPVTAMAGAWFAFSEGSLLLSPVTPVGSSLALYTALTVVGLVRTRRESGAVRAQFARFVAPAVIEELIDNPDERDAMAGKQQELTLLFSDARGFTTFSEGMEPRELIAYLNTCFEALTEAVMTEGGTVDKYMGDSIMAFWNAPLEQDDHADRALRAAFAMRRAQIRINEGFAAEGKPPVDFGVGLNTGPCSVGLMGSRKRLEYSCVGDTVNVASRLEGLTKTYGVWNVISEAVLARARSRWHSVVLDDAKVKGRMEGIRIHAVLGPADKPLAPELSAFAEAVEAARGAMAAGGDAGPALSALAQCKAEGIEGSTLAAFYATQTLPRAAE